MFPCLAFGVTRIPDCKAGPLTKIELPDFIEDEDSELNPRPVFCFSLLCCIKISSRVMDPLFIRSSEDLAGTNYDSAIQSFPHTSFFSACSKLYSVYKEFNSFLTSSNYAVAGSFSFPAAIIVSFKIARWDSD